MSSARAPLSNLTPTIHVGHRRAWVHPGAGGRSFQGGGSSAPPIAEANADLPAVDTILCLGRLILLSLGSGGLNHLKDVHLMGTGVGHVEGADSVRIDAHWLLQGGRSRLSPPVQQPPIRSVA